MGDGKRRIDESNKPDRDKGSDRRNQRNDKQNTNSGGPRKPAEKR